MSLPQDKFVSVSSVVQSPAFSQEKKHMILAMNNSLIPTTQPFLEFSGSSALTNFAKYFGKGIAEYKAMQEYFGFVSKKGLSVDKAVIVRWYKEDTAPFAKGTAPSTIASIQEITNGSIAVTFNDTTADLTGLDFSSVNTYSDVATILQNAINGKSGSAFTDATVVYSSITGGFIITGGDKGLDNTMALADATTGTSILLPLGLKNAVISDGVDAETFAELCDRIYNINPAGFAITTLEAIEPDDITASVKWLNSTINERSINTKYKLVFNFADKTEAKTVATTLSELGYTGYVITYDPNNERVNVLDCAIGATIDFNASKSAINFNFQDVLGYTPITNLDSPVDYENGRTNLSETAELDELSISYVYSVGVGTQKVVCYGLGKEANAFGTEDIQINESWLVGDIQEKVFNTFVALDKIPLQGTEAVSTISAVISQPFENGIKNGMIAVGGKLSDTDKLILTQTLGADAVKAVEANGYYFQIQEVSAEDIAQRRVRILAAYLASGVVNFVRVINNIYGA